MRTKLKNSKHQMKMKKYQYITNIKIIRKIMKKNNSQKLREAKKQLKDINLLKKKTNMKK
jgi:hypothetical protein